MKRETNEVRTGEKTANMLSRAGNSTYEELASEWITEANVEPVAEPNPAAVPTPRPARKRIKRILTIVATVLAVMIGFGIFQYANYSKIQDYYHKGNRAYSEGDFGEAISIYTSAIRFSRYDIFRTYTTNKVYAYRGFAHFMLGYYVYAIPDLDQAIKGEYSAHENWHAVRASCHSKLGNYEMAANCYSILIEAIVAEKVWLSDKDYWDDDRYQKAEVKYRNLRAKAYDALAAADRARARELGAAIN